MQSNSLGRREEGGAEQGLSGRGSLHSTPLPATVCRCKDGPSSSLLPTLHSQSPTSLLSGLLFVCDPPGRASTLADFVDLVLVSPAPVMGPWRGAVTSSPRPFSESVLNTGQRHACHGQEMSLTAQLYEAPIVHRACSVQQHFSLHWA